LRDKKIPKDDVSIQTTAKRVYTVKPYISQDLLETLRSNEVPFKAASAKGANAASSVARFGILLMYIFFLRRMYQVMGGGGQGGNSGPGKLATFNSNEPLVKFEDIEGIDNAKFEVMELVDTLRNPKKYEVSRSEFDEDLE
jgi:cell division protease FtsH